MAPAERDSRYSPGERGSVAYLGVTTRLQWFKPKANGFSRGMKPTTENHTRFSCTLLSVPFK
ncbi:MAG: hypothetical protein A07HR60_00248 [uncultured archaeon A07HR60]|nr:MAG: hypothetical protein A07HR60_00248 [uncultured archaeon A07HR60]